MLTVLLWHWNTGRDNIFADPAGGISCGNDIDCVYSTDHTDLAGSNYVDTGKIVGAGV